MGKEGKVKGAITNTAMTVVVVFILALMPSVVIVFGGCYYMEGKTISRPHDGARVMMWALDVWYDDVVPKQCQKPRDFVIKKD